MKIRTLSASSASISAVSCGASGELGSRGEAVLDLGEAVLDFGDTGFDLTGVAAFDVEGDSVDRGAPDESAMLHSVGAALNLGVPSRTVGLCVRESRRKTTEKAGKRGSQGWRPGQKPGDICTVGSNGSLQAAGPFLVHKKLLVHAQHAGRRCARRV